MESERLVRSLNRGKEGKNRLGTPLALDRDGPIAGSNLSWRRDQTDGKWSEHYPVGHRNGNRIPFE